jgi:hypothetical protein
MSTPAFDVPTAHRWFAVEANNQAWALLERADRTVADDDQLLHLAHASCLHWLAVGAPANHQRGLVLLTNAYAALGLGEPAVRYGKRAVSLLEAQVTELADWDRAFTFDAMARAYAAAGGRATAGDFRARARSAGDAIADDEDRQAFVAHFERWDWPG